MQLGKIVYQSTSKLGKSFVFRYPITSDLKSVWAYINTLSKEQTYITWQGEEVSLEDEQKWLDGEIKKILEGQAIQLFVIVNEKVVGISGITMRERAEKHVGIFGISLAKDFRNDGIGAILLGTVLKEAGKNLEDLKIVTLGVFGNNPVAKNLYKKMGFVEYGNLPKGILHQGKPVDHLYMYKKI
ncbi:GNAT family N-acetyltransferase [Candidatus Daviesbacteria bacterium]|nr:GNAT family N-acetyltransferase [Candidatus Daviesbacteria bacterium]